MKLSDDPGFSSLRRAIRAAIVIPAAFAFAKLVIGDVQIATFVAFGCFSLLVLANFGGPRVPRAGAYIATTVIGAGLVAVGTFASSSPWVAALVMFVVGFSIQFAGVFGGYVAASQTALLLSFVLAVSIPASPGAAGTRLAGWLIAGAVATIAGVFFWPRFERLQLRRTAAEACHALAALVRGQRDRQQGTDGADSRMAAETAVEAVRRQYTVAPKRPAGPSRRDRAFVELLTQLERMLDFATGSFSLSLGQNRPCISEGNQLAAAVVQTLESSADVLTGGPPPDLLALDAARSVHREALDRWAAEELRSGTSPEDVLAGLDFDHELRVISYVVLAIGTNATIATGGDISEDLNPPAGTPSEGSTAPLFRVASTIRTHLTPSSGVLHQSLRVGIGLALAVLLARLLRLDHAFWVVLGTLSVLRSNALGTGRTTMEALIGTVAGFAVGGLFTVIVGATSPVLWIALPIAVFLATYAASAIGFMVGQAGFTVLVIILFNLISPVGWRVGLVRIEDVAVGVGISVIMGLLLWPRGARGELGTGVAAMYRAVAAYLAGSLDRVLQPGAPQDLSAGRSLAVRARDLAGEAFDQFLNERGKKPLEPESAGALMAAGFYVITVGDLLNFIAGSGYRVQHVSDGTSALRAQAQVMLAGFLRLADRLDGSTSALLSGAQVSDIALRQVALKCLQHWRDDPNGARPTLAAVIVAEWVQQLGELAGDLEAPVTKAVDGARVPWWR